MNKGMNRRGFLLSSAALIGISLGSNLSAQEGLERVVDGDKNNDGELKPVPVSNFQISLCNSYVDFNKDGKLWFPVEFLGVKNKFGVTEDLTLIACSDVHGQVGKQLFMDIYNANGKRVYHIGQFLTDEHLIVTQGDLMPILRGRGIGNYAAVATHNGKLVGKVEFEIAAKGEVPKKVDYAEKGIELFACNWERDFDNNGLYDKDDFVGRKDEFNPEESLMVVGCSRIPGQEDKTLNIRVYNSRGNVVNRISSYLGSDALALSSGNIMPQVSRWESGMYTAIATLGQEKGGRLVARKDFEIKEPVRSGATFHYEIYPILPANKRDCGCEE